MLGLDFGSTLDQLQSSSDNLEKGSRTVPSVDQGASDKDKQDKLEKLLRLFLDNAFVPDEQDTRDLSTFFTNLYSNDFRHQYSGLMRVMVEHAKKLRGGQPEREIWKAAALERSLAEVIDALRINNANRDVVKRVMKLYDHVHLETQRMQYIAINLEDIATEQLKLENDLEEIDSRHDLLNESIKDSQAAFDKLKEETRGLENQIREEEIENQKRSITILGVFAAVVLAFNGAVTFSVSSINSVSGTHPMNVVFVVLIVGFFLFNALVALFTFIRLSTRRVGERLWGGRYYGLLVTLDVVLLILIILSFFYMAFCYWRM